MKIGGSFKTSGSARGTLEAYRKSLEKRCEEGQKAAAHVLIKKSLQEVPRDVEALADSAFISQVGSGFNTVLYVGYGAGLKQPGTVIFGPSGVFVAIDRGSIKQKRTVSRIPANYAPIVHFDTSMKHTNGKSHFLSDPITTERPQMQQAIRQAIKGGGQ